jgi:uncharacterized membrane protein YoaK (UPF0700 family)
MIPKVCSGFPQNAGAPVPPADDLRAKLLPFVLSVTAGSMDTIGFLGLGGLFTAHITGNLVILAAKLVAGEQAPIAQLLALPVFVVVLAMMRVLVAALERVGTASLLPLLVLQFLLLSGSCVVCLTAGSGIGPNTPSMILGGMVGVAAMAVQNALVPLSLGGLPTTAVMTTNVTRFTMNLVEMRLAASMAAAAHAREGAGHTWPAIAGFIIGCAIGAASESNYGLWSLLLPAGSALFAAVLGTQVSQPQPQGRWLA